MSDPVLTSNGPGDADIDASLIVNGRINIQRTHPNLYLMVMMFAVGNILLAINFLATTPTFQVYHLPNWVWGVVFGTLGLSKFVFLNLVRSLPAVRATMACAISFYVFFAFGTSESWWDGKSSLQLPIMYLGLAAIQVPMLLEPFLNPWTARRE